MSNKKGFTLTEILVALAIVSVGVLVLARTQILSIRGAGYNRDATSATMLAQKIVEDYRGLPFGTKPADCDKAKDGMEVSCLTDVAGSAPYRSNSITVRVSWGTSGNQIALSTMIAER